jgi:acetylornithine deacetylase/succinyl-diaminopimelate desuccinylase-like protein
MQHIKQYVDENRQRLLDELFALLRFPSVSADPKYKADVLNTADHVAQKLRDAGADNVEVCQTAGYPIVYGEKIIDAAKPTVSGLWPLRCTARRSYRIMAYATF